MTVCELPGLSHHGDVADWLVAGHSRRDLLRLAEEREAREQQSPAQHASGIALIAGEKEKTFPWPEMREEGWQSLAGEWTCYLDGAEVTETDPVAVLVQVLAGFAAMVGPGPNHLHGAEKMPAKTNVLVIGESARAQGHRLGCREAPPQRRRSRRRLLPRPRHQRPRQRRGRHRAHRRYRRRQRDPLR